MALLLKRARDRIRIKIRDIDPKNPVFDPVMLDQHIADAYIALQGRLPAPIFVLPSAFTITGGTEVFTLPNGATMIAQWTGNSATAEYAGAVRIRLRSTGAWLEKLDNSQMDSLKVGAINDTGSIPNCFSLTESRAQAVTGRVHPGAKDDQICDLYATLSVDDLRDFIGAASDDLDDVALQLSRLASDALVYKTCALLVAQMVDEDLARLRLNPGVVTMWTRSADQLLYEDAKRIHRLKGKGGIQRWES